MKTNKSLRQLLLISLLMIYSVSSFSQTTYAEEHKNFEGISKIEVKGSFCDVEIVGTNRDNVKFDGIIKGSSFKRNKKFEIRYSVNNDLLSVWVYSPFSFSGRIESELRFTVPSNVHVKVKNSSGDISCEGLNAKYTFLSASSGDINAFNIKGDLNVSTSSGEILVRKLVGNLEIESTSGNQELKEIVGNIKTRASSGDIEFSYVEGDVVSETTSGDLEIDHLVGRLKNVSSSGNLEMDNSKVYLHLTATSGDIQAHNIVLLGESYFRTTSGNVDMLLKNDPDQLSFDLIASSGSLRAGNKRGDRKLYLRNGEIWIHGKSSSGDQTYN
ncbi:DUF4097 family beta strand repeat-containing protein [Marinifilum sp.]|uniref:DUF4097 family beta strand repeat-containing protein n=1 Tax=Marinifilum sp. TaxID=2033137 RepID=UPI003BA87841